MIVFQGNGGLRNPQHVLNYTSTCNPAGRSIARMDRKHCVMPFFQREYPKEVFHKLCNLYKDRKIAQKTICMLGHINKKKFSFE